GTGAGPDARMVVVGVVEVQRRALARRVLEVEGRTRGPTPTAPQMFESHPGMRVSSAPPVAGFGASNRRWWLIVVGAAIIAALSFLITSAVLDAPAQSVPAPSGGAAVDAAPGDVDAGGGVDAGAEVDAGKKKSR
ncbi:MAG: hypothetical protein K8M05_39085, partial [Deltaproteobacteria bacterium]|nr:hypothetical protein [Kofleriaceae bacterium]